MAWESASFPWDWDADALLIEDHESCTNSKKPGGSSMRPHVAEPHAVRNGKPSLTSRDDVRKACSMSSVRLVDWEGPGQIHGEVGSAMPSTCRVFPSGASFGQGIKSGVVPEKSSILTGCIGNGFFGQQGVQYTWKRAGHRVAGLMEPGNQEQTNMVQPEHHKANFLTQKIEGFGSEVQVDDDAMEGIKAAYTDEHHSSNATGSAGSGDSLTGLQLGKRTYSLDLTRISKKTAQKSNMAACKKARTTVAVVPRCQVEGCKLDLTSAKDYYRRHKVCEPHSKFEKVVVASMEQRFCQQCSRFHLLSEFDEAKRSCRRRLAGHNERRRKPQLDTLALQAGLRSSYEDWSYLHQPRFSRMSLLWQGSSGFRSDGMWPCTTTAVEDRPAHNYAMQGLAMGILDHTKGLHQSSIINDDKLSLLLQSPKTVMPQDVHPHVQQWPLGPLGGPIGDTLTLATASAGGVLPGLDVTTPVTCTVTRVSDSGRALSLLSLQPQGSQAPGIVKLEPPGLAELTTLDHHQPVHDEEVLHQPFPLQAGQQHHSDFHVEKMMGSMDTLYFQPQSTGGAIEKTVDCSYAPDLNRQASSYPLFTLMPYHQEGLTGGRPAQ